VARRYGDLNVGVVRRGEEERDDVIDGGRWCGKSAVAADSAESMVVAKSDA
jgi:hypothetical protein